MDRGLVSLQPPPLFTYSVVLEVKQLALNSPLRDTVVGCSTRFCQNKGRVVLPLVSKFVHTIIC
jgi:hypothetical protein